MKLHNKNFRRSMLAAAIAAILPMSSMAGSDIETLKQQVEVLQRQLQSIQTQLKQQETASKEVQELKNEVKEVVKNQGKLKKSSSVVHLAGYGSIGYTDNENTKGRFNQVQFSPIFHYQYKDLMMLGAELEVTNEADGTTSTALEYATLDLLLHDYAVVSAGKFLSPIGQFRQNLHPGWINKMPSAPPGFGHDGAAPVSETGLQVRGGFPVGTMRSNYAVYVGNGPELESVDEGGEIELEGIMAEGRTSDADGNNVWGGRFGLLPVPSLEIGASFATGKAAVTAITGDTVILAGTQQSRDYDVLGADINWQWNNLNIKGEYVQSKVGADVSGGQTASSASKWETWYTQAAYKFLPTNLEGVLRYTDFNSPHASEDQEQWAVGVNYLFAPNIITKLAYEANDGQTGATSDDDSVIVQLSYGF